MNPKVSIIIPFYNAESYIYRSLESVIHQTYSNIECIVIDDGSNDNTMEVIGKYKKIDNRIKCYKKENGGVSSARNLGIKKSNGDYIIFLDSDDWIEEDCIEKLIKYQKSYPGYFLCVDRYFVDIEDNGKYKFIKPKSNSKNKVVERKYLIKEFCKCKYNLQSSCYKLYISSVIKENNILFDTSISHGEDGLFVFRYMLYFDGIIYFDEPLWCILDRVDSATNSAFTEKWFTAIEAVNIMMKLKNVSYDDLKYIKKYYVERSLMVYRSYVETGVYDDKIEKIVKYNIKKYKYNYIFKCGTAKSILSYFITYLPFKIKRKIYKKI